MGSGHPRAAVPSTTHTGAAHLSASCPFAVRRRRAAVARSLQGAVHRQRRAPRQARAAHHADALRKSPTATSLRSSSEQSQRSSSGSRPGATPGPTPPARRSARQTSRRRHAASPPLSAAQCANATGTAAATWTSKADVAPRGTGLSSTTFTRSAWAGIIAPGTSGSCARATTATWPSTTTAGRRSGSTGGSRRKHLPERHTTPRNGHSAEGPCRAAIRRHRRESSARLGGSRPGRKRPRVGGSVAPLEEG